MPNQTTRAATTTARSVMAGSEPDLNGPALVTGDREELAGPEAGQAGDQVGRQGLYGVVVGLDRAGEELPRVRDLVLGVGQLDLQGGEVLVGLEIGVGLGDRD